MMTDYHACVHN